MMSAQTSMVTILFAFQVALVHAQQAEGQRWGASISVVRQEGSTTDSITKLEMITRAAGTYRDPMHGVRLELEVDGSEVKVSGSKKGKAFTGTGTIEGNSINIDMSSEGESEMLDGTLVAGGIQWSNGHSWTKQGQGSAIAAKKKAGRSSPTDSDFAMSTDETNQDELEQSELDGESEDADSTKPGHLPRIAFIAFLAVALLVMGTDEGKVAFAKLQDAAMLALGKAQAVAKAKDPKAMLFNAVPIVNEAASVMEFGNQPRRPREAAQKPQVSAVIEAAFEDESTLPDSEEPLGEAEQPEAAPLTDLVEASTGGDDLLD